MLTLRKSQARGHADHGWLKSYHSFSFAEYVDPAHMGWGNLRVINEDRIAPGTGFGTHGHRDMEIISYVLEGNLAHKDSMGNVKGIPPGDVQRMSAGRGVMHSEFNHAAGQTTHFLQIWIEPSPDGAADSVTIHADARIYAGLFDGTEAAVLPIDPARKAYVFVARGSVAVNDQALDTGDAALLSAESRITVSEGRQAEVLVFDLAP